MNAIELQRPGFGQFATIVAHIPTRALRECLLEQRASGGRLGQILVAKKLLKREQLIEIHDRMADWVAKSRRADMRDFGFPRRMKLSVCMPAFNEEDIIEDCLDAACAILPHFVQDFEIVVVNDGSRDATGEIIANYAMREPRVRLINFERNKGYGAAVSASLKAASGDYVMFTDGDGQFSLLDLPQLLEHVESVDYVIGYRHCRAERGMRRANAWAWNRLVRLTLGVRVRDLDCAFKLFPRDVVQALRIESTGACINAEILSQCVRSKLTFREVPVMHYPRCYGAATGANLRVIRKAFRELATLLKYRSSDVKLPSNLRKDEGSPLPGPHGAQSLDRGRAKELQGDEKRGAALCPENL